MLNALMLAIMLNGNLTDYIIGNFGWDFMQPLWDLLDAIFGMLNFFVPNPDMWNTVWEVLFT